MIKKILSFSLTFRTIIIAAFTFISVFSPLQTFADFNEGFYSTNDIDLYNQSDATCSINSSDTSSGAVSADATANAKTIFEFLVSTNFTTNGNKPMTAIQAAGVLGNIQTESGFNPASIESGEPYNQTNAMNPSYDKSRKPSFGYGFGIAQWSYARRVNLLNFATGKNTDWTDINTQLVFMANELDTTHNVFNTAFASASTPSDAANLWNKKYEGSADTSSSRSNQAETWYNQFKGLAPSITSSSDLSLGCASNGGISNTGSGQCNTTSCTTGDGTAASIISAAMSMALPTRADGIAACKSYCGGGPAQPTAYATALKQYNIPTSVANQYYGACCATFVSTVLQVAGVENDFSSCGAGSMHNYLRSHPNLFQHVAGGVTSISGLKPGDILADDGDVYVYIGGNNVAGASYGERMPDIQSAWFNGPRDVYRVIKAAS